MKYEVIESKVWRNKVTGQTASIYGACPWTYPAERDDWEIMSRGWTIRNPYTNEVGICQPPWKTKEEAEAYAETHKPNKTLMYD